MIYLNFNGFFFYIYLNKIVSVTPWAKGPLHSSFFISVNNMGNIAVLSQASWMADYSMKKACCLLAQLNLGIEDFIFN